MDRLKCLFTNLLLAGDGLGLILRDHEYDGHVVKAANENFLHPNITMHILPPFLHNPKVLTRRICSSIKSCLSW